MAERTGVTIDTLRYYEREGLIVGIARSNNGHRRYRQSDVTWIGVLRCLRETGMTIDQLRRYCELGQQGSGTEPERIEMLAEHREQVEAQIAIGQEALRPIDHKLAHYKGNQS